MEPGIYIVLAIIVLLIIIVISNIKIVPQAYVFVVERLGAFHAAWGTGLHVKVPFIDRVAKRVSIKEQVVDFKPQSVITKDNVTMQIDTVVFFQITNAMQFTYGVERPISAIENLTATTLRNIVGDLILRLRSLPVTLSTQGSQQFLMKPQIGGASRCRELSLRIFFRQEKFRTQWKSR